MPAASTSGKAPLVHRVKHKHQSWFSKHIAEPWDRFSLVESIFVRKQPPSPPRSIHINQPLPSEWYHHKKGHVKPEHHYYTNQIVTSKYTVFTYLPRNLLEQFRRVANCFFLAIAILQFFPKFSTISPGLVILPLLVVIAITAAKDAYEDVKRHQADHRVNNSIVHTLGGGDYKNINPMKTKSKTFSPRMAMPLKKSKKAKKREAGLGNGRADVPPPEPRMGGADLHRARSQVSTWEDDPEAGDSPKELGWQRTIWEDVKVGDFVKIYDNEQFPAGE
jgi:phospholipid-translocating ATPase